jgi:hypothetical protein
MMGKKELCIYCLKTYDAVKEPDHQDYCKYAMHSIGGRLND